MQVLEFQMQSIVARSGRSELHSNCQILVVNKVDLGFGGTLHSEVDATGNTGFFAVNNNHILLIGLSCGQVWSAHFDLVHISLVSFIVTTDPTIEWTADYVSAVIFDMNFIIAPNFWCVGYVYRPVLIVTEINFRLRWT